MTKDTTPAAVPGVTRYRKKPIEVEAVQWDGFAGARWLIAEWGGYPKTPPDDADALSIWVVKSQRMITLNPGDWAIREADRTGVYPCAGDVFAATYEPVSEPGTPAEAPPSLGASQDAPAAHVSAREGSGASWRERAEAAEAELEDAVRERTAAEAQLARITTHCRRRLDTAIVQGPVSDLCRDILAIIGTEEESRHG